MDWTNSSCWQIESLDAKLNQADQDASEKSQVEKELEAAREKVIRLETKCDLLEKVSSCGSYGLLYYLFIYMYGMYESFLSVES